MHKAATAASWVGGRCLGARGEVCRLLVVVVPSQIQKRTILEKRFALASRLSTLIANRIKKRSFSWLAAAFAASLATHLLPELASNRPNRLTKI